MSIEGADPELIASIIAGVRADLADRRRSKRKSGGSDQHVDEVQLLRAQAHQLRAQAARLLDAAWRAEQRMRFLEDLGCSRPSVETERASALAGDSPATFESERTPAGQQPGHGSNGSSHGAMGAQHS